VRLRAFVTFGGWEGHDPEGCATWVAELLRLHGFDVELADTLAPLHDERVARELSLVVPVWSLAEASGADLDAVVAAVTGGTGLAAFHGATASFRRTDGMSSWDDHNIAAPGVAHAPLIPARKARGRHGDHKAAVGLVSGFVGRVLPRASWLRRARSRPDRNQPEQANKRRRVEALLTSPKSTSDAGIERHCRRDAEDVSLEPEPGSGQNGGRRPSDEITERHLPHW
jgi:hypothetical protein